MQKIDKTLTLKNALVGVLTFVAYTEAGAVEIETDTSLTAGVTLTDNVCLSENNAKWDWVGVAAPHVSVKAKGRQSSASLSGSVRFNTLTNGQLRDNNCGSRASLGERRKYAPNLRASGETVLIDQWLTLNARAQWDQQEIGAFDGGGDDELDRLGNRNDYFRYSVSPTLSHQIGRRAMGTLQYTWDEKVDSSDLIADSNRQQVSLSLQSVNTSPISGGVFGRYSKLDNERRAGATSSTSSELGSVIAQLGYQLSQRLQINGSYGWDQNDYDSGIREDQNGARWDVGIRWTPTPRTTVDAGFGDRYFGSTPRLGVSYERRRSNFELDYSKGITYDRDLRDLERGFLTGFNGSSIDSENPVIDERVTLQYGYDGRNANITVRGSWSEQTREDDGARSVFKNLGVTFTPQIFRLYNVSATVAWDEDDPRSRGSSNFGLSNRSESWRVALSISRSINQRLSCGFNYQFRDRNSEFATSDYRENRFTANVTFKL